MMRSIRVLLGVGLLMLGWVAGRAHTIEPDFTIAIDAPEGGDISVVCVKGCALQHSGSLGVCRV
jgi:hypothetical protein